MALTFRKFQLHARVLEKLPLLGFHLPTAVQEKVIPQLLQKQNLIVEAATGTGKTAAYGLPVISGLNFNKRAIQALVLTPSRELTRQVAKDLATYSTIPSLRIGSVFGGTSLQENIRQVKAVPQILVAVPGRLRDVLDGRRFPFFWRDINFLIIDEADKLLEHGFQDEVDALLSNVKKSAQVALFSATINKQVEELIRDRFPKIRTVRLSYREALNNIKFVSVISEGRNENSTLKELIIQKKLKSALIFCRKRDAVYSVVNYLRSHRVNAEEYHGMMDQVERKAVMDRFRSGKIHFLVATDLAARGLDIFKLPAVINFHTPDDLEVYLHRAGRTGRAGSKGTCYNLVTSGREQETIRQIHAEIGIGITEVTIAPGREGKLANPAEKQVKIHLTRGKKDKIRKADIVGYLANEGGLWADQIGTISVYGQHTIVSVPDGAIAHLEEAVGTKIKGKTVKIRRYELDEQKARAKSVKKLVENSKERKAKRNRMSGKPKI